MTRLQAGDLADLIWNLESHDAEMRSQTGYGIKGIAACAVTGWPNASWRKRRIGMVTITSGGGAIPYFATSLQAIAQYLGQETYMAQSTDLAGIAECTAGRCDVLLMADDRDFVALDIRRGRVAHNDQCTGSAYAAALHLAADVMEKKVAVVGAGPVGMAATIHLLGLGALVTVIDQDQERLGEASRLGVEVEKDLSSGLDGIALILNASPAEIKGEWLENGCLISSPGMPFHYDKAARAKAVAIIHDPLQLGTAAMLASLCLKNHDESSVSLRTEV